MMSKIEKLSDQELVRRKKLQDLKEKNLDPFLTTKCLGTIPLISIVEKFKNFSKEELESCSEIFTCCGRILFIRQTFLVISEEHTHLQAYINLKTSSPELVDYFQKFIDIGDFVCITGPLFLTKLNELTIRVQDLKIVSKCLKPLPEKHSGIKNPELLVRERVASLITNQEVFNTFINKSKILWEIRKFLMSLNYLEVETPILHKIAGGAVAKPFFTHYNSLNQTFFLRIAPELDLKKLITAGYTKIFEIGRCFRNEGIDSTHNPEFTTIEIYTAYEGLEETMKLTESLFHHVSEQLKKPIVKWQNHEINISKTFKKASISELVAQKTGIDFYNQKISLEESLELARKHGIFVEDEEKTVGHILHKLFEELVEKDLVEPTLVYGYHKDVSPLAKSDPNNPDFVLRFELFIGGKELANGFSELNDPIEQLERFKNQSTDDQNVDYEYIHNIEYGLPPTGGLGIGIDRMVMLFTEKNSIKETVFFPHIKKQ